MKSNTVVTEGFRRNKYPERKPRDIVTFQWVHDPIGRAAKYFILRLADQMLESAGDSVLISRRFVEAGLSRRKLLEGLKRICPDFSAYYFAKTGRELTEDIVYDRWHKTVYVNGKPREGGKPNRSAEHYTSSTSRLRKLFKDERCEHAFLSGRAYSLKQMEILGS